MAADRQTDIHTTSSNAVTLVWGSLRLAPIRILLLIISDLNSMTVIPLLWSQEGTCLSANTAGFSIRWCQKANTDNAHSCFNYAHLQGVFV